MSEIIIPKPGTIYNDYICQGSDGNYYVKNNGIWVKVAGGNENIQPLDPRSINEFPSAKKGDKYYVVNLGAIQGIKLDKGDMLICITDTGGSDPNAFDILQANINPLDFLRANDPENYNSFYAYKNHGSLQIKGNTNDTTPLDPIGLIIVKYIDPTNPIIYLRSLLSINSQQLGYAMLRIINQSLTEDLQLVKDSNDVFCDIMFNTVNFVSVGRGFYQDFYTFFYNGIGYLMQF